jgi:RNA polymerase sigma-70 factor, ECF subfamily
MTEQCYRGIGSARPARPAGRLPRRRPEHADEELIRSLYRDYGACLIGYATRLLGGDRTAAEDIVQEVLLRAWRRSDSLNNGRGSVRSWLLTVTRNAVIDHIRARAARPRELVGMPHQPQVQRDHGDAVADAMTVVTALGQISTEHREVLVEVYYQGRTVAEAAQRLGLPPGTVKSRTFYALRALRQILAEPAAPGTGPKVAAAAPKRAAVQRSVPAARSGAAAA